MNRRVHALRWIAANWRRPTFWLTVGCGSVIAFSLLQVSLFAYGRDHGIFAVLGEGILQGKLPYRDLWDFKPPGIFLTFALAQAVFGAHMASIRILEVLCLALSGWFLVLLGRRYFADARAGLMAATLNCWVSAQLDFWHSAQPETFAGFFTLFALVLLSSPGPRRLWQWVAAGACFGLVFLYKPPLAGPALVCFGVELRSAFESTSLARAAVQARAARRDAILGVSAAALGAALPIVAVVGWLLARGAGPSMAWTFEEFAPGYTRLGWDRSALAAMYSTFETAFVRMSALFAVGSLAAVTLARSSSVERGSLSVLAALIALQGVGIALQAKFFEYHFAATLPLVSLLAGLGFSKVWSRLQPGGGGSAVAFACLVGLTAAARRPVTDIPEGYWVRSRERLSFALGLSQLPDRDALDRRFSFVADYNLMADRDVAARVQAITEPTDYVYVWGFEPAIYWFAQRQAASRFIYNVPQRAKWQREGARQMLLEDLRRHPPRVVVVQHGDYFRFVTGDDLDSAAALGGFEALQALLDSSYSKQETLEDFDIYVRSSAADSRPGQPSGALPGTGDPPAENPPPR